MENFDAARAQSFKRLYESLSLKSTVEKSRQRLALAIAGIIIGSKGTQAMDTLELAIRQEYKGVDGDPDKPGVAALVWEGKHPYIQEFMDKFKINRTARGEGISLEAIRNFECKEMWKFYRDTVVKTLN